MKTKRHGSARFARAGEMVGMLAVACLGWLVGCDEPGPSAGPGIDAGVDGVEAADRPGSVNDGASDRAGPAPRDGALAPDRAPPGDALGAETAPSADASDPPPPPPPDATAGPDAPAPPPPDATAPAGNGVLTQHNDNQRSGANLAETTLTPALVGSGHFGKLYCRDVDDEIYAQLLYVPAVSVAGRPHDLLVVATVNNTLYGFDAADGGPAAPLWQVSLAPAGATPFTSKDASATGACGGNYTDASGNMGIIGTPVVDRGTGTVYLVTRTKEAGQHVQRLHAIGLGDGAERPGSPVVITAVVDGTGRGSAGGKMPFMPGQQNQRPALLLHEGAVLIAWASHCDGFPYHGWLMAYDPATLRQLAVMNTTPNGGEGGIWMSGQGPATDGDGFIYLSTGNGDVAPAKGSWSQSALKLRRAGGAFTVADYFTPSNWLRLNAGDRDFGAAGVLVIPGTPYMVAGGKDGRLLLLDRANLGKVAPDDAQIPQWIQVTPGQTHIHGAPVFWRSEAGDFVYLMAEEDYLKQFRLEGGRLTQYRASAFKAPDEGAGGLTMPGGILSISARERQGGIVWVNMNVAKDANRTVVRGVLRAFDASDVTRELWNSEQLPDRDSFGSFAKFNPPTVYGGRVYLPTFSRRYCVYGPLP